MTAQCLPETGKPALVVAPMEGVTDAPMRALLAERGGFSYCVSEFLRVSQYVPPKHVFLDHIPELLTGSKTASGIPVQIQLLGGDAERLAETAALACSLGAPGIDLNFGCPAPTVNRHDGGATLLKHPLRIREIVAAVRAAVPASIPVSAKLRLGWDSMDAIDENSERAAEGGASWITIHGRTKVQGYIPPAYWEPIGRVRRRLGIPVVANGEIWTLDDFRRCRDVTGSEHFMLGRGALADPGLPQRIAAELGIAVERPVVEFEGRVKEWISLLERFTEISDPSTRHPTYMVRRVKQWMRLAHGRFPSPWFEALKRAETLGEIYSTLGSFECLR